MKRIKFLALLALSLFIIFSAHTGGTRRSHEFVDFTSTITKEDCYLCGARTDTDLAAYWGQDNVGIINVNTFEVMPIKINTYDWNGTQIEEPQGAFLLKGGYLGKSVVHEMTDPDRGDSHIDIQYVKGAIDQDAISSFLCQDCLDIFVSNFGRDETPPEIAVVNFATREICPLLKSCPWFSFDNFAVGCDFQEDKTISLLIYYCPVRFQKPEI